MSDPQRQYFVPEWRQAGWRLQGHSRARERTGFLLSGNGCQFMLDAGVDLPTSGAKAPNAILITHTHIDHVNALPMLLRHRRTGSPCHIVMPKELMQRTREFTQMSWAIKVDQNDPLPRRYLPPPIEDTMPQSGSEICTEHEGSYLRWRPVEAGSIIPIQSGGKGTKHEITVFRCFHSVTTCGYGIAELRHKLKPEYLGANPKETGMKVRAAKAAGEEVNELRRIHHFAFLCDTTIEVLQDPVQLEAILQHSNVMIECTFLEGGMSDEARKRGHIVWTDLLPFVVSQREGLVEGDDPITWVLFHFSLRYKDDDVRNFFLNGQAGLTLSLEPPSAGLKPDIVLWLDSGVESLWVLDQLD